LIFYGIIPVAGALYNRYKWRCFRKLYNNLRLSPLLNYRQYCNMENDGGIFRFTGGIESLTDAKTLWIKSQDCTIPVSLEKSQCWLLPMHEDKTLPDAPEQIRWNRVSTLTEGVKVFIGGKLKSHGSRLNFESTKENPLVVIFYNCPDEELTGELILAARTRNEYWNTLTPVSLVIGALSLIYIAASLLSRPAFHFQVITALVAVFVPILPVIPPGLLFTAVYRRLTWNARKLRAYRDLIQIGILTNGSLTNGIHSNDTNPKSLTKPTSIKAYALEITAWIVLLIGVTINLFFVFLIISFL
jgi:hypothetical protein